MTLDERVKVATKAEVWSNTEAVRAILRAAFPELFSDPATAWLAPFKATPEMLAAYPPPVHRSPDWIWVCFRDAFLTDPVYRDKEAR